MEEKFPSELFHVFFCKGNERDYMKENARGETMYMEKEKRERENKKRKKSLVEMYLCCKCAR